MVAPPVSMNTRIGGLGFGQSDGEYLPIVKVQPIYPQRAAARGTEGYVIVQYTVTTTGDTKDVEVIESTSSLFDRAAIESAMKYKYKPRVIDGTPVEVTGVTTKIIFELED
jgi:protein TonB